MPGGGLEPHSPCGSGDFKSLPNFPNYINYCVYGNLHFLLHASSVRFDAELLRSDGHDPESSGFTLGHISVFLNEPIFGKPSIIGRQGHNSENGGTGSGRGTDSERPMHQMNSFLHTHKP